MTPSYDDACLTLARHFLGDDCTPEQREALAQHIQYCVEEWLAVDEAAEGANFAEYLR